MLKDAHCCHFPFYDENDVALFCVLDGHAGQEAALLAAQLLPKVFHELSAAQATPVLTFFFRN